MIYMYNINIEFCPLTDNVIMKIALDEVELEDGIYDLGDIGIIHTSNPEIYRTGERTDNLLTLL